jgi:hypothetical protein
VSSSDGFCSFILFDKGELGEPFEATGELAALVNIPEWVPPQQVKSEGVKIEQQQEKV